MLREQRKPNGPALIILRFIGLGETGTIDDL